MQSLAIIPRLPDSHLKKLKELQNQFNDLSVQVADAKDKQPKPFNQRANVWCTNCGGHGHLPIECPTPIGNKSQI